MIVVDTSIFIDQIFEYDPERTAIADGLFRLIEERKIPLLQPDVFKIEFVGQMSRRLRREEALTLAEEVLGEMNFIGAPELFEAAFSIALETGSRAIASFYIAAAKLEDAMLISNDRFQVDSAKKFGIEVYYLIEELEQIERRLAG